MKETDSKHIAHVACYDVMRRCTEGGFNKTGKLFLMIPKETKVVFSCF